MFQLPTVTLRASEVTALCERCIKCVLEDVVEKDDMLLTVWLLFLFFTHQTKVIVFCVWLYIAVQQKNITDN